VVAEYFFSTLEKERIKKRISPRRDAATSDLSDYIDGFYNPILRHSHLGDVSTDEFEATNRATADQASTKS
jgi:putative transposase